MIASIANGHLKVSVAQCGAELCSIQDKSMVEYIWEASPEVWGRHSPILFPVVGRLKDDRYQYEGNTYSLPQHGFARDCDFELTEQNSDSLVYSLRADDATRRCYPFEFLLKITYKLHENVLSVCYSVTNNDSKVMPFSIGGHPAFSCSWFENDFLEDYYLEFEKKETVNTWKVVGGLLDPDNGTPYLDNEKIIKLGANLFSRDALVFSKLQSNHISLCSRQYPSKIQVDIADFPYLGIWSKPGAQFVSIEPWHGHADLVDSNGEIENKPGIIKLAPGASFDCSWHVTIKH